MRITIREGMVPGDTFAAQLVWLQSVGIDGIELHANVLRVPGKEIVRTVSESPIDVSAIEGIPRLLDADQGVRSAAVATIRERLALAGELGAVGVLIVPQFGRTPALLDLSPWRTAVQIERELLLAQLEDLVPAARKAGVSLFLEPLNRYEA